MFLPLLPALLVSAEAVFYSNEIIGSYPTSCTDRPDGYYPVADCSTQFLTCSGGIARMMSCPSRLVYNPDLVACNYPMSVATCSATKSEGATSIYPVAGKTTSFAYEISSDLHPEPAKFEKTVYPTNLKTTIISPVTETTAAGSKTSEPYSTTFSMLSSTKTHLHQTRMTPNTSTNRQVVSTGGTFGSTSTTSTTSNSPFTSPPSVAIPTVSTSTSSFPTSTKTSVKPTSSFPLNSTDKVPNSEKASTQATLIGTTESTNICNGLPDGFYTVGCSSEVIACENNIRTPMHCPEGSVFDVDLHFCVARSPLNSCAADAPSCSEGSVEAENCSSSFTKCLNKKSVIFDCKDKFYFSKTIGLCIPKVLLPQCK